MPGFTKLLVANRGEIACRVIRSARAKGYRTVAVFSEADAAAPHVTLADEAFLIGPAPVGESYLNADRILAAAKATGADAVHPGYGFLSEDHEFAAACAEAGLVFVGPPIEAVRLMGDKAEAKKLMVAAGVPCVPGYHGDDQSDATLAKEADRIGFPVMVKAASGGGGRGMRLVHAADQLGLALRTARSEAKSAFGDDRLLLERAVIEPRHVEIQIFADTHRNAVYLGERDCSVQRRHQKVVEEAPSPSLTPELRAAMGAAAVQAAKSVDYVGAGTVEFLLDADRNFYFLEMNTRLQVEHTVTEEITGIDLVALQLDVAAGLPLPFDQEDVILDGHAIEVRLYAEDARNQFLPQTGDVLLWRSAQGDGVRIDDGIASGSRVSPFYDPMVAKIIAWGEDRAEARRRLVRAVEDSVLLGVTTNKDFLIATLNHPEFAAGEATTGFIGRNFPDGLPAHEELPEDVAALAAVLLSEGTGGGWHSAARAGQRLKLGSAAGETVVSLAREGAGWRVGDCLLTILANDGDRVRFAIDGHVRTAFAARTDDVLFLDLGGAAWRIEDRTLAIRVVDGGAGSGTLRAPMNGTIAAVEAVAGARVRKGDVLATLEAMKMEHQIVALVDGTVSEVMIVVGAQVAARDILIAITPDEG